MLVLAELQVARDEKLSFTLCKRHVPLKNIDTADTIGQWLFTSHDTLSFATRQRPRLELGLTAV